MKSSINPTRSRWFIKADSCCKYDQSFYILEYFQKVACPLLNYSLLTLIADLSFFENAWLLNLTGEHQKQDCGGMRTLRQASVTKPLRTDKQWSGRGWSTIPNSLICYLLCMRLINGHISVPRFISVCAVLITDIVFESCIWIAADFFHMQK